MPEWMMEKETNGTFENDVCRVLGGKLAEVEERRERQLKELRRELNENPERRKELSQALRSLREELDCLRAIA